MRQIRFRAWDITHSEWIDLNQTGLQLSTIPGETIKWKVLLLTERGYEVREDIEFHQYTGLYCDDGIEIAEGDIVHAYKPNSGLDGLYMVMWDAKRGKWSYKNGEIHERYQVGKTGNSHCHIRGNLRDDPKLYHSITKS